MRIVVVRGWPVDGDDRLTPLLERLRSAGITVVDVFVEPAGCSSMTAWAARVIDRIDEVEPGGDPLRLLGYCLGGHVTIEVTALLTARGRPPAHVALVDTWDRSPEYQLAHGTYRRYQASWRRRIRHQLLAMTRPRPVPLRSAVRHWSVAFVMWIPRWFMEVVIHRGEPRRRRSQWWGLHLAYDWTYSALDGPVHLYNADVSIDENDGDPAMGLAANLRGGYVLRRIGGDHLTCLDPPYVEQLARLVVQDLDDPVRIVVPAVAYFSQTGRVAS